MEVEANKIQTWKNLDRDGDSHASQRQTIANKIRALNDKFQGNDASAFQASIEEYIALLATPFPLLYHVKIITKLFELAMSFALVVQKRPQIAPKEDCESLVEATKRIFPAFSDNMQKNMLKAFNEMYTVTSQKPLLDILLANDTPQSGSSVEPSEATVDPRRIVLAETVLARRTSRISLVLDRCYDVHNIQAVLRTAECLGIQHVWIVEPVETRGEIRDKQNPSTKGNHFFLSIRRFLTSQECVDALRAEGRAIWVTDLAASAQSLDCQLTVPDKVAIVIGREADGCSEVMKQAADQRVYLPLHGFTESLNLSVAAALVLQKLFHLAPEARGDMREEERQELRAKWFSRLAPNVNPDAYNQYVTNPVQPLDDLRKEEKCAFIPQHIAKRVREKEEAREDEGKLKRLKQGEGTENELDNTLGKS